MRIIDIANMVATYTGASVMPGSKIGHDPIASPNMGRIPGWLPTIELKDGLLSMIDEAKRRLLHEKKQ